MKKLISLLLCLVMILSVMTACGGDDKSSSGTGIVGTWEANVKLSDYEDMGDLGEMEEYLDLDKMVIGFTLKLTADGEYKLTVNSKSIDKLVDVMCDGMEDYMKAAAKEYGMSYKDMLKALGCSSIKDFLDQAGLLDQFEQIKGQTESGEYTWEDGVLTMDGDEVDAILRGNTLTIEREGIKFVFKRK